MTAPKRALLGFAAAVVSVLTFHQGMWALLHAAGLMPPAPYPTDPVPPFGVPRIANFCFWAGDCTASPSASPCRGCRRGRRCGCSGSASA